jgi:hypothetical protein
MLPRLNFRSIVVLGLLATIEASAAACFPDDVPPPRPVSNWTIGEAREFRHFELYWLGESYDGLPLTLVQNYAADPPFAPQIQNVRLSYGELKLPSDLTSADWYAPLRILTHSSCEWSSDQRRSFQAGDYGTDEGDEYYTPPPALRIQVRGVDGYVRHYPAGSSIVVWTGSSIITLSTSRIELDIEQVAEDLIPISGDPGATPGPLPPPTAASCE